MRGTAGKANTFDGDLALEARLSGPAIRGELVLKPATQSGAADVVSDG